MKMPELLAPAGDPEKLEAALRFGADAIYLGGQNFGLRAAAANFDQAALAGAIAMTHRYGKQLYLTLNAYARPAEFPQLAAWLEELRPLAIDAYIVADPGVLALVRQIDPQRPLHLSTQANTTNAAAANLWQQLGVSRVNLARELTLAEIAAIRAESTVGLEVFVHGAMCMSYSGRCLLSAALNQRSANQGACTQPCRWKYALVEETRPNEFMAIEEDERGTYIMNSRDLCLAEHLPALITAGIDSLKIEGRMKSVYYVAAVTRVYRAALDAHAADPDGWHYDPLWRMELDKVSHRPYDSGFLFGGSEARIHPGDSRYRRACDFVGSVEEVLADGSGWVGARNRFFSGEVLELIGPKLRQSQFVVSDASNGNHETITTIQPNARVRLPLPPGAAPGDLLRRNKEEIVA